MAEYHAARNEPSLSLPIRLDKKRKRTRTGGLAVVIGVGLLAGTVYNLTRSGTEVIAVYLAVLALPLLSIGITQLVKASKIA